MANAVTAHGQAEGCIIETKIGGQCSLYLHFGRPMSGRNVYFSRRRQINGRVKVKPCSLKASDFQVIQKCDLLCYSFLSNNARYRGS